MRPNSKKLMVLLCTGSIVLLLGFGIGFRGNALATTNATPSKTTAKTTFNMPHGEKDTALTTATDNPRPTQSMALASIPLDEPFFYNPKNRIDPFKPFLQKILPRAKKARKAMPLTPLQKLTLNELQRGLVAIVWGELGNRALIQDSAGKGYIVRPGTPVGLNGVVKQILSDRVIVEQTVLDPSTNREVKKEVTLRLKRGAKGEI